ncbi:hypothetical protein KP509_32G070200 [Ceratopteris richardii]|uniref:Uncharacterized protein n=1 Tax=Ceratopteris richardii TaxID=49495 RepID=A0A8T2QUH4_CERRI|nr:hypothetical protein KP509_32G070200 [Ceratopteris richardii]
MRQAILVVGIVATTLVVRSTKRPLQKSFSSITVIHVEALFTYSCWKPSRFLDARLQSLCLWAHGRHKSFLCRLFNSREKITLSIILSVGLHHQRLEKRRHANPFVMSKLKPQSLDFLCNYMPKINTRNE